MKLLAALFLAFVVVSAYTEEENRALWHKFTTQYSKVYAPEHYYYRYKVFCENLQKIEEHNKLGKSYTLGINEFADLTWEEFKTTHLSSYIRPETKNTLHKSLNDLPEEIDWEAEGKVTKIKDQGQCGSCWAFSAIAAIETTYAINNKKALDLSEQELVDCSRDYGNEGCNGGLMDNAFKYIVEKKGIASLTDYPYTARDGQCKKAKHVPKTDIKKYVDVPENDTMELKAAAAETAVAVAIEADQFQFQFYSGGVFDDECGTELDHGVAVVGYGHDEESDKDFWKVRNSWGGSWGLKGYILMVRHDDQESDPGICGINMAASYIPVKQ
jgi:C1A family cysteine protease